MKSILSYPSSLFVVLFLMSALAACDYRSDRKTETASEETAAPAVRPEAPQSESKPAAYAYAVYLENSGSMDGYVRGTTAFEDDIYKLLVDISYLADTVSVAYINNRIIPHTSGIQGFINNLEPASFQQRGGNRSSSNINEVIERVLQETTDNKVSVLISDYIFSTGGGNTAEKLNNQKISIYNTFRSKLQQQPFATLIIKLHSEFNGSYYDRNDRPVVLKNARRPYYVWLIGPEAALHDFVRQVNLKQLRGFDATYWLSAEAKTLQPFYTVLTAYHKAGNFRADRQSSGGDYVHGISNITAAGRGETEGQFAFSLAIDMSQTGADESYLLDPANYSLPAAYQISDIQPVSDISDWNARDQALAGDKATHVLTLTSNGKSYADVQIALKRQTPAWVVETHTDDDTAIQKEEDQLDKTFGFGTLVAGMEEAYQNINKQENYFTVEVSVKK